ncbi:742_t:CDS:2 [Cetraspora pellucida]|uniref:742_t:CDS:1 n=1 Tax=Cetraspora pellucida TaxID=1433469 RepID=A0A9N9IW12_9GLOM|nr:742_t:CDS:2 [Cetraspora pellucida]
MFSYLHNSSPYQSYQRLEEGRPESSRASYTNEKVEDLTTNVDSEAIDQLDSWYYLLLGKGIITIIWFLIILVIILSTGLGENKEPISLIK